MTRKLSVTAACNAANKCVGKPVKFGQTSWQVFFREPGETASRSMQAESYAKALEMAVETKALIALDMLAESHGYATYYCLHGFNTLLIDEINQKTPWRLAVSDVHKALRD